MHFPIIVLEGNDVALYSTVAALTTALEAPDVEDATYDVFDAAGYPVLLGVSSGQPKRVVVRAVGDDAQVDRLTRLLADALGQSFSGSRRQLTELGLVELLEFAADRLGYEG